MFLCQFVSKEVSLLRNSALEVFLVGIQGFGVGTAVQSTATLLLEGHAGGAQGGDYQNLGE